MENAELLQRTLSSLLQQSLVQSKEELTNLLYRALFLHNKLKASLPSNEESVPTAVSEEPGTLRQRNFLGEAREVFSCLVEQHEELSMDVLANEICRAEILLEETKAFLRRWQSVPQVPMMEECKACVANALEAVDQAHLAHCEGSVSHFTRAVYAGLIAVGRGCGYLDLVLHWISTGERGKERKRPRGVSFVDSKTDASLVAEYENLVAESGLRLRLPPLPAFPSSVPSQASSPGQPGLPEEACQAKHARLSEEMRSESTQVRAKRTAPDPELAPDAVLRAQQLLEGLLPFLEQQVAVVVSEARGHLRQWTSGVSQHVVISVDDA